MQVFKVRNVNEAFPFVLTYLMLHGHKEDSRNGKVLVAPTPVMTIYKKPKEKVLFAPLRDANPFFHLMESIWMLAGCNDAEFLNYYVRDFGDRYGEGGILHGAYGHRWRNAFGFDQLDFIIQKFRKDQKDRQCVLQHWDCSDGSNDIYGLDQNDLKGDWKDRPCQTHVYFRINEGKLDITTMARSHDSIFGATGANAVHFPILQEYIAGMVGIPVGKFYQFSNNYHAYSSVLSKLLDKGPIDKPSGISYSDKMEPKPLITDPDSFDQELKITVEEIRNLQQGKTFKSRTEFKNEFLSKTVLNMAWVHHIFKTQNANIAYDAALTFIDAPDWREAAKAWLLRRIK